MRDIFARLEFRTLLPRVFDAMGGGDDEASSAAPAVAAPAPAQLDPQALADWVAAREGELALTVTIDGGLPRRIGVAGSDAAVEADWSDELAAALREWLESDAPKVLTDAKPQVKALRRAGIALGGLAFDPILAGWLQRPSFPDKTLGDLVERYLDEKLPEADPQQLVPETEGATPGQLAWYALRVTAEIRDEMPPSVASVLTDIELPTLGALADMELAGVAVSHEKLSGFSAELAARADDIAQRAYAEIDREVNLGSPKQLQEVLFEQLQLPKTRKTKTGY
ncbi:DNA polymerase, partial [Microbacterium lacticum]|uniref:DNA polymerase n=1 Tax=Microbacterium lacticum TaxID=33885 RepID=UPI001F5778DD